MECWLLNARHMRNVPGRKTDIADAEWICQLIEHGLVRPSFVPPPEIRELRELTRYRRTLVEERTREAQRLDKVLQDAGVKLSSVASDVLGVSGRDMLAALVSGTATPRCSPSWPRAAAVQAARAAHGPRGPLRARHALLGRGDPGPSRLPRRVDRTDLRAIEEVIAPFAEPGTGCARSRASTVASPRRSSARSAST